MVNNPIELSIYNTNTLQFEEITSITGTYSKLVDTYTAEITPVSQNGEVKYVVTTSSNTINVPVFFASDYYKNTNKLPSYENYFPIGLESFSNKSVTQAMMYAYNKFFENIIPDDNLIPITSEWNMSYPQYCDNNMLGIAINLIYQERINNNIPSNMEYLRVYTIPVDNPTSTNDFILTGSPIGSANENGKYNKIDYGESRYLLKYGSDASGNFCGKGKVIYIQPNYTSGTEEELLEFNTTNPDRYWNEGLWDSINNEGELYPNLDTVQGVPASCEFIFNVDPFDIVEEDYDIFYLPDATMWTAKLSEYDPIVWFNNIDLSIYDKSEILINYDVANKYFTFKLKKV